MQTKTYTPEFRAEAVELVLAQGLSLEEAAQRITMPNRVLKYRLMLSKSRQKMVGYPLPALENRL